MESTKGAVVVGLLGTADGAALGAAIGGFGGGTKKGFETDGSFKEVFKKCMQYRGHTVLGYICGCVIPPFITEESVQNSVSG